MKSMMPYGITGLERVKSIKFPTEVGNNVSYSVVALCHCELRGRPTRKYVKSDGHRGVASGIGYIHFG